MFAPLVVDIRDIFQTDKHNEGGWGAYAHEIASLFTLLQFTICCSVFLLGKKIESDY